MGLQELIHFLSTDMVVLNVNFLHDQKLIAKGCKVEPRVAMPRQQLTICERVTGSKLLEVGQQFGGRFTAQQKLLEENVFCGALDATGLDMSIASNTKPVCSRDAFEAGTGEMVGCIASIANDTGGSLPTKCSLATGTGSSF